MKEKTYEDKDFWENIFSSKEHYLEEKVITEGNDGEDEFDLEILNATIGKIVLDVGCGNGNFTDRIAKRASMVVGVDFSKEALLQARDLAMNRKNMHLLLADAHELPLVEEAFDVAVSRRGPVTDNMRTISGTYGVLKRGGCLMEITIGEKDKLNLKQIFDRGQLYGVKEKVAHSKRRMLKKVGFKIIDVKDYFAKEIFQSIKDLMIRLKSTPIIPDFDVKKDRPYLEQIEKSCKTEKGIETQIHRVTLIAVK